MEFDYLDRSVQTAIWGACSKVIETGTPEDEVAMCRAVVRELELR
jgi:hypothetical protein